MAVTINKHFWTGVAYSDIAKIVYTSPNFDSPAIAGTRSHAQPGGKYIGTWYEAVDFMYKQKENQDYFNARESMESFFGVLELRTEFDLDRDSSAEFKTEYNSDYFINDTIDYIYKDKNNYAKVSTSESFLTVSGIDITFIVPDHTKSFFFGKTNKVWWNSSGLNNDELLDIYIAYNGENNWHLLSNDIRNTGSFSFIVDFFNAKGFMDTCGDNYIKAELLPAKEVYRAVINESDTLVQKGYATLSAIIQSSYDSTSYQFYYKETSSETYSMTAQVTMEAGCNGIATTVSENLVNLAPNTDYDFKLVYNVIGEAAVETEIKSFTIDSQYKINYSPYTCQAKLRLNYLEAYDMLSESFYMKEESFSSGTPPEPEITYSPEVLEVAYSAGTPYQPYVPPSGDRIDSLQILSEFSGSYSAVGDISYNKYSSKLYRCETGGLYVFDNPTNKWTFLTELPFVIDEVSVAVKLNNVYVMNCCNREFYKYDVASNLWTKLLDFTETVVDKIEIFSVDEDDGKLYAKFLSGYNYMSGSTKPSVCTYEDFNECTVYIYNIISNTWELLSYITTPDEVGVSDTTVTIEDVISKRNVEFDRGTSTDRILLPSSEIQSVSSDDFIGPITCYSGSVYRHESQGLYELNYNDGTWKHVLNSPMSTVDAMVSVEDIIYLVDGNYFYAFNIVTDSWEQLRDIDANCVSKRGQELYCFEGSPDNIYLVSTDSLYFVAPASGDREIFQSPTAVVSKYTISTGYWSHILTTDLLEDCGTFAVETTVSGGSSTITADKIVPFVGLYKDEVNDDIIYALSLVATADSDTQVRYVGISYINLVDNSCYNAGVIDADLEVLNTGIIDENGWGIDDCSCEVLNIGAGNVEFLITVTQTNDLDTSIANQEYQFIRGTLDSSVVSTNFSSINSEIYNSDLGIISTASGIVYSDTSMVDFRETLGPKDVGSTVSRVIRTASDENYVYMFACMEEANSYYSSHFYRVPFRHSINNDPYVRDRLVALPGTVDIFKAFIVNNGDTLYSIGKTSNSILTVTLSGNYGYECTLSGGDFVQLSSESIFGPITTSGGPYTFSDEIISSCVYDELNNVVYAVGGKDTYNFSEIDLSMVMYSPLAQPPWLLKTDNTSCFLDDHVYVIQGPNSSAFAGYSTLSGTWEVLASLPPELESEYPILCAANNTDYLYLVNNKDTNLYVYSIDNDMWEIKEDLLSGGTNCSRIVFDTEIEDYFKYYTTRYNMIYLFKHISTISPLYEAVGQFCVKLNVDTMSVEVPLYEGSMVIDEGEPEEETVPFNYNSIIKVPGSDGIDDVFTNMVYNNNLILVTSNYGTNESCLFYTRLYSDYSKNFPVFIDYKSVGQELFSPIFFHTDSDDYVYCISVFSEFIDGSESMSYEFVLIRRIDTSTGVVSVIGTNDNKFSSTIPVVNSWADNIDINSLSGEVVKITDTKFEFMITYIFKGNNYGVSGLYTGACFRAVIDFSDDFLSYGFTPVNDLPLYYDIHKDFQIDMCSSSGTNYVANITSDGDFFYMSLFDDIGDTENNYLYRLPLKTSYDAGTVCSGASSLPWYLDGSVYKSSVVNNAAYIYALGGNSSSYLYRLATSGETDFSTAYNSSVFNSPTALDVGPYVFDKGMMKNILLDTSLGIMYLLGEYFINVNISTNVYSELAFPYFNFNDDFSFVILSNYIYLSPGAPSNIIYRYSIVSNFWEELSPFPTSFVGNNVICKANDTYLYLFNSNDSDMYKYNTSMDSWEIISNYFENGADCPEISVLNSIYKDGSIYIMLATQIVKFDVATMSGEYYYNYNYSSLNSACVVGNSIYTNIGNSLVKQNLEYSQSDPIDEVVEIPEVPYVPYRSEIQYSEYVLPTYSGSNYDVQITSPGSWEFSTDLTSPDSVIMNFDVNFSSIIGDGVLTSGTLMYHQFSNSFITKESNTPINRYHCGENSIIFEVSFGEAYDCRLTAWDDDTHSTTSNKILSESHYSIDAAVYRSDYTTDAYNPKFMSERSLVYPPCNNKILKGNESYYGDFDFIYAVNAEDNGEFLAFIPRLSDMDETFAAGNYDFITTLHYQYT